MTYLLSHTHYLIPTTTLYIWYCSTYKQVGGQGVWLALLWHSKLIPASQPLKKPCALIFSVAKVFVALLLLRNALLMSSNSCSVLKSSTLTSGFDDADWLTVATRVSFRMMPVSHGIFVSTSDVQYMECANYRIHYGLYVVSVCLRNTPSHYHHYANLSEGIELLKFLSGICCRVCKIQSFLSIIFFMIYGAVSLQLTQFSCDDRENMYESR